MKKILLFILTVVSIAASGQTTRIRNLTTEPTYSGALSIPCDKSTYSVHHKIFLSTIYDAFIDAAADRDTAMQIWEEGSGTQSIQAVNSSDTATGSYAVAHGYQTWAGIRGSRSYSSGAGKAFNVDGWAQCIEFTAYGQTGSSASDTMLVGSVDNIIVGNNFVYQTNVRVLGVGYTGADAGKTYSGEYQFVIKNVAGTTSLLGLDTIAENVEAGITATFIPTADDTNEYLILTCNGTDGGNMFWKAEITMVVIKFD